MTRTVRGSRTEAPQELVELARVANMAPVVGARTAMEELLERWNAETATPPNKSPSARTPVRRN